MTAPVLAPPDAAPAPSPGGLAGQRLAALKIDRSGVDAVAPARPARRWLGAVVLALAVAAVAGWWLMRPVTVLGATVMMSTPSQQFVQLTASGHVVAQIRAAVASKATGLLVELRVSEGSQVHRGDLIARLESSDVSAALQGSRAALGQAEAGLQQAAAEQDNARLELQRSLGLQAQGFISSQAVDTRRAKVDTTAAAVTAARAGVEVARAQVGLQKVNLAYTEIRAPFDGVVLVKNANVGDIITTLSSAVGAQGAVVTLADLRTLEVEVDVSEANLSRATIGQPVEITLDALQGVRLRGSVASIVPTVDRAKATVTTKIRFERIDPRILPEMSAKVSFLSQAVTDEDQRPVLTAPAASVRQGPAGAFVLRVQGQDGEQRVETIAVTTGRRFDKQIELRQPPADPSAEGPSATLARRPALKAGDRLVIDPISGLADGAAVRLSAP